MIGVKNNCDADGNAVTIALTALPSVPVHNGD